MIASRAFLFRLPLQRLQLAGREYRERTGLLLCDAASGTRWAEASPLPGWSRESLEDVITAWRQDPPHPLPSLEFALESLEQPAAGEAWSVPVNGLLLGTRWEVCQSAAAMSQAGYRAVKLKLGPTLGSPDECAQTVRDVRNALAPSVALRLDANRAWSLEEAVRFGTQLRDVPIEYCEEPTRSPRDLERFWEATRVPYALDETLRETDDLRAFPHAAALIAKPTLLGGRQAMARWQRWGIPLVFSGAFESGVGTLQVARLAREFSPGIPAGLDAYRWLQEDVLRERLGFSKGRLQAPHGPTIRWNLLQEVSR